MATTSCWCWNCSKCRLPFALVLLCILSFTFLPSNSGSGRVDDISNNSSRARRAMSSKFLLGSRPPRCINRCMNCWPCTAVLVIPPHRKQSGSNYAVKRTSSPQDDEGYYLLSWKCRCKNKLFQP